MLKHLVAALSHMMVTESKMSWSKGTFFVKKTCGHVMLHKSDSGRFMLHKACLPACRKPALGQSLRPGYASQTRPLIRENHTC